MQGDAELLSGVRSSDREAFRQLFEHYQPLLFRYLMSRTRDRQLAHDVIQETFLRLWSHRSTLRPDLPVFPYLVRISGNLIRDRGRHSGVEARYAEEYRTTQPNAAGAADEALDAALLEERIRSIVGGFPERRRMIFLLSRMEGKSNKEISDLLGITIKTVENQLTKGLSVLRKRLARDLRPR